MPAVAGKERMSLTYFTIQSLLRQCVFALASGGALSRRPPCSRAIERHAGDVEHTDALCASLEKSVNETGIPAPKTDDSGLWAETGGIDQLERGGRRASASMDAAPTDYAGNYVSSACPCDIGEPVLHEHSADRFAAALAALPDHDEPFRIRSCLNLV
jgi:hypothetical protein